MLAIGLFQSRANSSASDGIAELSERQDCFGYLATFALNVSFRSASPTAPGRALPVNDGQYQARSERYREGGREGVELHR